MKTIVRWNPVRDLVRMRGDMDRYFDDYLSKSLIDRFESTNWGLALDIAEKDEEFVVKASVPGVKAEDLEITISDNTLVIKGEVKTDESLEEGQYRIRERRHGKFRRSLTLPRTVNRDDIVANHEDGVLTLVLPKLAEVQPRRVAIKSNGGNGHKVGEGESA